MKQFIRAIAGVALIAGLAACAPAPAPVAQIECTGLEGSLAITPGLTNTPANQTYRLDDSASISGCTESQDLGITGATIRSGSLLFPSASCLAAGTAAGSGLLLWNDGSSSAFTMTGQTSDPVTVRIAIRVVSGAFEGSRGSIDLGVTPTAGTCDGGGITAEDVSGGSLTLAI